MDRKENKRRQKKEERMEGRGVTGSGKERGDEMRAEEWRGKKRNGRTERTERKCPDEYTAPQEDLLIGGTLSPSVAELGALILPSDGMRLHKFPVMARVNSCRSGRGG